MSKSERVWFTTPESGGPPMDLHLFEIGTRLGHAHARQQERFQLHWREHLVRSREMILRCADRVSAPRSATVLGAGSGYNIPLEELARRFEVVRLVDIDRDGLDQAAERLSEAAQKKLEIHVADLTGGVAARLLGEGLEIIHGSVSAQDARDRIGTLFKSTEIEARFSPDQLDAWGASCIISSGVASQLAIFPEKAVAARFQEKFGSDLDADSSVANGLRGQRRAWVSRHGELLASLVELDGRVYWADTVTETPCLREFGAAALNSVVDSVVRFLQKASLKTLLTDSGKEILAERFAQATAFRLAGDAGGRCRQGKQLLQSFRSKSADKRRILAWAIMTEVGEGLLSPEWELELLGYILGEAERMYPQARQPTLNGRLADFFPAGLRADGDMASWIWINDPEGTVTLNGNSYGVEAYILKPDSGHS